MSGSYCGVRVGFYLLMVVGALLFLVMVAGNPSPDLKLEDCDWFVQLGQKAIETPQTLDGYIGDTSNHEAIGGGGAPTDQPIDDDAKVWEMALAGGECPARNAS